MEKRTLFLCGIALSLAFLLFIFNCGSSGSDDENSFEEDDDDDDDSYPEDDDVSDDDDDSNDDDDDDDDLAPYSKVSANGQIRAMVADTSGPIIYCADSKNNSVVLLDTKNNEIMDTILVGSTPIDLDLNPDGDRLWVATSGASAVSYINLGSKEEGTVNLAHKPLAVAVGGNGKVYVVNDKENIEIIDEDTQTLIGEVEWDLADKVLSARFIEIDRGANLGYVANAGLSPSSIVRFDLSDDNLDILEDNEHGSLGSNGQSLTLAPSGDSLVFPNGSGNGAGYTVYLLDALDFTNVLGEFDIGTYPLFMEYDPLQEYIAGINGDPYDERIYVMDPVTFLVIKVLDAAEWINNADADPPISQDPLLLRSNASGSVLVLYAEDTYNDLKGNFYLVDRDNLL